MIKIWQNEEHKSGKQTLVSLAKSVALSLIVTIVASYGAINLHTIREKNIISVPFNVIANSAKHYLFGNREDIKALGKSAKTNGYITKGMRKITQRPSAILKQGAMHEKKEQKEHTHLKNGSALKKSTSFVALSANSERNSLKTISLLYQTAARITFQTYSLSVGIVTAGNGNLNIHTTPKLLEQE